MQSRKTERQIDNKIQDDEKDLEDIQTTSNDLLRSKKGCWEVGGGREGRCHQDFLIY